MADLVVRTVPTSIQLSKDVQLTPPLCTLVFSTH
jgi:hypothetical protein